MFPTRMTSPFSSGCVLELPTLPFPPVPGRTAPDVLVIHCGGNDLGHVKSVLLVKPMKKDLQYLHKNVPLMKIMFSLINQRCHWRYGPPGKMEKARKFVNSVMDTFVLARNGITVHHSSMVFDKPGLFLRENVNLTDEGHDIFLSGIILGLKVCFSFNFVHLFWVMPTGMIV